MIKVPKLIYGYFCLSTFAIMSVPPVVAPERYTRPRPVPLSAAPMVQASSGSCVAAKPRRLKPSMKIYVSAMPAPLMSMNLSPKCRHAKAKSGMLSTMLSTPTGAPVRKFTIVETPVTPPGTTEFG